MCHDMIFPYSELNFSRDLSIWQRSGARSGGHADMYTIWEESTGSADGTGIGSLCVLPLSCLACLSLGEACCTPSAMFGSYMHLSRHVSVCRCFSCPVEVLCAFQPVPQLARPKGGGGGGGGGNVPFHPLTLLVFIADLKGMNATSSCEPPSQHIQLLVLKTEMCLQGLDAATSSRIMEAAKAQQEEVEAEDAAGQFLPSLPHVRYHCTMLY